MWVEFVVGSHPCSEGFSPGTPIFLLPQKSTLLNPNLIWNQWMKSHFVEVPLQIPIYYLFYYFIFCFLNAV